MLLYPMVSEDVDATFPLMGKNILIRTLDLSAEWESIKDRLLNIID